MGCNQLENIGYVIVDRSTISGNTSWGYGDSFPTAWIVPNEHRNSRESVVAIHLIHALLSLCLVAMCSVLANVLNLG